MIDQTLLTQIAANLSALAARIEGASVESCRTLSLPFAAIREGYPRDGLAGLDDWAESAQAGAQYIYRIAVSEQVARDTLHAAFRDAKDQKLGGRAYARLHQASHMLYVGSSSALMSRLKQHLGFGPKGTYAMQICHWLPAIEGDLKIQVWRFAADVPKEVIQAIEDGLWAASSPMFGRQGAR
ncbi:GIY-YIG nuclease family protein [Pseudomonas sp. D(2018)]|uniref:GIY-YIG nuclease family protein n=1 Tax=Pseudomonas sp. D(2018) TaxID=2502238 RepID=UPI0010F7C3BC|nr:GIY-YIG nuclease family protein [Pseudomonas sp. D(2018)]